MKESDQIFHEAFEQLLKDMKHHEATYQAGKLKFHDLMVKREALLDSYGITKKQFYAEIERRLGKAGNETKEVKQ